MNMYGTRVLAWREVGAHIFLLLMMFAYIVALHGYII